MNIVEIIKDGLVVYGAYKAATEVWRQIREMIRRPSVHEYDDLSTLSTAFFDNRLRPGQLVRVNGRFSRYGHIHCPRYLYAEARDRHFVTNSWVSEFADRVGKRQLIEGSFEEPEGEFLGFEIFPAFPMSTIPPVQTDNHAVGLGFLYPSASVGSESWIYPRSKSVPVLYPINSDVPSLCESVVRTTARVCVLPEDLDMLLISLRPKISCNLLDTWYRPLSFGNRGFCLSLVDVDGEQDAQCSMSVGDPGADVPLGFLAQWTIEYHFEGIDLTHLSEDAKRTGWRKGGELLSDILSSSRPRWISDKFSSWHSGVCGTGFGWDSDKLKVSVIEPNRLLVWCKVNLVTEIREAFDWLPGFGRRLSGGMADLCGDVSAQKGQPSLDFLYDFAHQGHYQSDGALSSHAASDAVAGSQPLQHVRGWLLGGKSKQRTAQHQDALDGSASRRRK